MDHASPYIKKKVKEQMLHPLLKCDFRQSHCRFAIIGYCLESYKPYACEYVGKISNRGRTFEKKGG